MCRFNRLYMVFNNRAFKLIEYEKQVSKQAFNSCLSIKHHRPHWSCNGQINVSWCWLLSTRWQCPLQNKYSGSSSYSASLLLCREDHHNEDSDRANASRHMEQIIAYWRSTTELNSRKIRDNISEIHWWKWLHGGSIKVCFMKS